MGQHSIPRDRERSADHSAGLRGKPASRADGNCGSDQRTTAVYRVHKNERLDRRTASVYGDDIGLSAARARRAMDAIMQDPLLSGARSEHEGRGYVQSDDVVNAGFTQGQDSFVRVAVVYDERLPLDNYEGVDITRVTQELRPKSPYELNVMHITVDGKPIDDPGRSSSDVQRCTDVALDNANIQFRFDNLQARRRLSVAAHPVAVAIGDPSGSPAAPVHF